MIVTGGKMVIISKEPMAYPPMKIYRGNDPTLIEFPIKKTGDKYLNTFELLIRDWVQVFKRTGLFNLKINFTDFFPAT